LAASNAGGEHAPCRGAADPDPNCPRGDGSLDVYGLDPATMTLFPAVSTFDLMSYCNPKWISACTYAALFNHFHPGPDLMTTINRSRLERLPPRLRMATIWPSPAASIRARCVVWNRSTE